MVVAIVSLQYPTSSTLGSALDSIVKGLIRMIKLHLD